MLLLQHANHYLIIYMLSRNFLGHKKLRSEAMKSPSPNTLIIAIILFFIIVVSNIYAALVLQLDYLYNPSNIFPEGTCMFRDCNLKKVRLIAGRSRVPAFLEELLKNATIGLVNLKREEFEQWKYSNEIEFERVSSSLKWEHLYPEYVGGDNERPSCPEIPMPDFSTTGLMDVIVARIPCQWPKYGWKRDVLRLQIHLVMANLAAKRVVKDSKGKVRLAFLSSCQPMIEIFRCDDIVKHQGQWWFYEIDARRLEEVVAMPVGSCSLALPVPGEVNDGLYNLPRLDDTLKRRAWEAYATVLHSSDAYTCGAISLALSIRKTGSKRDLLLLHDKSIPSENLEALRMAGWNLRLIRRIRSTHAKKNAYNKYNYSKLRLWQLTDYNKIVFIDSDIIVLKNLDFLFYFPQVSATVNNGMIFNSGIMVIEPSNCTFKTLMDQRNHIVSYNGGDQGFLNEVFVWWHRLSRRVNFLKWANGTKQANAKEHLYSIDPPQLYAIHFLGKKPWRCYRDYDCNWLDNHSKLFASNAANRRWWQLYDEMDAGQKKFCSLPDWQKTYLDRKSKKAGEIRFPDGQSSWNITDKRKYE